MKVFKHYGEEIQMEYGPVDGIVSRAVVDYFKAQGIHFRLLPVLLKSRNWLESRANVFEFDADKRKYVVTIDSEHDQRAYVMDKLPVDCDIWALHLDITKQENGENPMEMQSKFKALTKDAWSKAMRIVDTMDVPECEKRLFEYYKKKAEAEMPLEEEPDSNALFVDEVKLDRGDPIERSAKYLYQKKVIADILQRQGYDYDEMKYLGDLDHHDIPNDVYENDLKSLYEGFSWEIAMKDYVADDFLYNDYYSASRECDWPQI